MLIHFKSPVENQLRCDAVWGYFNLISYKLIQTWGSFTLFTSIGFILILLWYELLYLWVISLRKLIYLLLLFLVNNLNMIPLIVRLKRSTILAFRADNVIKNLTWHFLKKFCAWEFKNVILLSVWTMTVLLFLCSNSLVRAPLISSPCFNFWGKCQPYLDSTSIINKMNLWPSFSLASFNKSARSNCHNSSIA